MGTILRCVNCFARHFDFRPNLAQNRRSWHWKSPRKLAQNPLHDFAVNIRQSIAAALLVRPNSPPNDQCVFEHPTLFEVGNKRRAPLIRCSVSPQDKPAPSEGSRMGSSARTSVGMPHKSNTASHTKSHRCRFMTAMMPLRS